MVDGPRMTEVVRVIKEQQAAYSCSKRHRTEINVMAHVNACCAVNRILRRAKRNKEEQVALDAKRNPKAFYCYINDRRVCRESIAPSVDSGSNLVSDDAGMAQMSYHVWTQLVMQFEKNICVFLEKNIYFLHKKLGLQKKTLIKCFFFFQNIHLKEITS